MKPLHFFSIFLLLIVAKVFSQPSFNANTEVPEFNTGFLYGVNPGYYSNKWPDTKLADIAKNVGANCLRPTLPEWFVKLHGYNIRINEFNHYKNIGMDHHTLFFDNYENSNRDRTKYGGCAVESSSFQNLFTDIWDNGANGTPVNDNNHYALYVYNVVSRYKDYVKFWEVLNEPDFCLSADCESNPGTAGNWWENEPKPCDLKNLRAPIFHYIRMLRITYEIVKTLDPNDYVCVGGIGYKSFLDACLRYTDNPNGGAVSNQYPLKGGAYFDVVSYHAYPQYKLRRWSNQINGFAYNRNSDSAADTVMNYKIGFENVLNKHGYNGTTFPKKHFIVTEYNVPRKTYTNPTTDHIGSPEAQKNAMAKTLIKSQMADIKQLCVYQLGDTKTNTTSAADGYDLMGLYEDLTTNNPGQEKISAGGVGFKTTSLVLKGYAYDPVKTTALNLPSGVEGAAFKNSNNQYRYALWARTTGDRNESASKTYSFPASFGFSTITKYEIDFSVDFSKSALVSANNISLSGAPSFFAEANNLSIFDQRKTRKIEVFPNPTNGEFQIQLEGLSGKARLKVLNIIGEVLLEKTIMLSQNGTAEKFDIGLKNGIYVLQVTHNAETFSGKLIVN